ncbi:MAG: hypothetical protein F4010_04455 [Cenarchaeum sp. SB0669_bin_11]|nr:hypothetical protein [Cenarchaeum sp. SB0669_bin_11]
MFQSARISTRPASTSQKAAPALGRERWIVWRLASRALSGAGRHGSWEAGAATTPGAADEFGPAARADIRVHAAPREALGRHPSGHQLRYDVRSHRCRPRGRVRP